MVGGKHAEFVDFGIPDRLVHHAGENISADGVGIAEQRLNVSGILCHLFEIFQSGHRVFGGHTAQLLKRSRHRFFGQTVVVDGPEPDIMILEDGLEAVVVIPVGMRDDCSVEVEPAVSLEARIEEGLHIAPLPGINHHDALPPGLFRRDHHQSIALPHIQKDDLQRAGISGVVFGDKPFLAGKFRRPDHRQPTLLQLIRRVIVIDHQPVPPQHLPHLIAIFLIV